MQCGLCTKNCKASCIDGKNGFVDYSRCVTCGNCMAVCPKEAIEYKHVKGNPTVVEANKTACEVAAAGNNECKEGRDDSSLSDSLLALDSVELLHHLRKSPGTERCEDNNTEEVYRVGSEK